MHEAGGFAVAEFFVGLLADGVFDLGIRGHFGTALGACPLLGLIHHLAADAGAAKVFLDIPALEIAYMIGFAILDVRANAGFEKPDESSIVDLGDRDELRIGVLYYIDHLFAMVFLGRLVPKQEAQPQPFFQIALGQRPDVDLSHWRMILAVK